MFAPCINSIKTLFIIPTDAHNYKIIGMLKTIKIPTIAKTCFGSSRNHHQDAIQCLAETIGMAVLCSSLLAWSMLWRHISLCASVWYHLLVQACGTTRLYNWLICRRNIDHANNDEHNTAIPIASAKHWIAP